MNKKKMIAPIIITAIVILYYLVYFTLIITVVEPLVLRILLGIIPIALSVAMLCVCIQRINEIKSGEEDDLDRY